MGVALKEGYNLVVFYYISAPKICSDKDDFIREVAFDGSCLIREVVFDGSCLIRRGLLYSQISTVTYIFPG